MPDVESGHANHAQVKLECCLSPQLTDQWYGLHSLVDPFEERDLASLNIA